MKRLLTCIVTAAILADSAQGHSLKSVFNFIGSSLTTPFAKKDIPTPNTELKFIPPKPDETACHIVPTNLGHPVREIAVYVNETALANQPLHRGDMVLLMKDSGAAILLNSTSQIADTKFNHYNLKSEKASILKSKNKQQLKTFGDAARARCFENWTKVNMASNAQ